MSSVTILWPIVLTSFAFLCVSLFICWFLFSKVTVKFKSKYKIWERKIAKWKCRWEKPLVVMRKNCWLWRESRWSNRFNLLWVKEWDCCQLFHENRWEMPELFMWRRRLLWGGTGRLCRLQKPSTKLAFLPRNPCCNTPCVGYMYTLTVYYRVLYTTFLFEEEIPYTVW